MRSNDEGMDKYSVVTDEELEKTSGPGGGKLATCPKCGRALDPNANVPHCPGCGTEPFEKRPDE